MSINIERIELEVNIDQIEFRAHIWGDRVNGTETEAAEYSSLYQAWVYNAKANEPDPVVAPIKGTRRPGNRAERRKATIKAKRHLKEIEPLTMSVRRTRNGGVIKRGDTYSWLPEWKAMDRRNRRHTAKEICRDFVPDEIDTVSDPWAYTDEEYFFAGGENLHGDFDDSATEMIYEDYHNPGYLDDDWDDDDNPCSGCMADDTIADLRREIARYKDFLGEFNLNTLYERWLADNNS